MDKKKVLEYCLEEARNGKDFGALREELEALKLQPKEIDQIIKYVDDQLLNQAFTGARRSHRREYYLVGWFLALVGGLTTVLTYIGIIDMGSSYIIAYGPVIAGLGMIISNRPNS